MKTKFNLTWNKAFVGGILVVKKQDWYDSIVNKDKTQQRRLLSHQLCDWSLAITGANLEASVLCRASGLQVFSSEFLQRCVSAHEQWWTPWHLWRLWSCDVWSLRTRPEEKTAHHFMYKSRELVGSLVIFIVMMTWCWSDNIQLKQNKYFWGWHFFFYCLYILLYLTYFSGPFINLATIHNMWLSCWPTKFQIKSMFPRYRRINTMNNDRLRTSRQTLVSGRDACICANAKWNSLRGLSKAPSGLFKS